MKPKMNLLENLQQQTASFKEMDIRKTEDWAKEQAKRNIARWNFFQKNAGNKKAFSSLQSYYDEEKWFYRVKPYELDEKMYAEHARKEAEQHFEDSLCKLCARILKKDMRIETLMIDVRHVDVNLECEIWDGIQRVTAYTILAWGPIYRPHYRYIIK